MNHDRYPLLAHEDYLGYEFVSDGPNGKIRKVVTYSPTNVDGLTYFNLAFGHLNPDTRKLDDKAISNNQDKYKILATVAATVVDFTECFPDRPIFVKGSTQARTRLYQMGISANWAEINAILEVYGSIDNHWYPFRKHTNYEAFLAWRKKK